MSTFKHAGGILASAAAVATSAVVLANAFEALIARQTGELSLFFTTQAALAAALFLPAILSKLGDRETLSVYRAMRR